MPTVGRPGVSLGETRRAVFTGNLSLRPARCFVGPGGGSVRSGAGFGKFYATRLRLCGGGQSETTSPHEAGPIRAAASGCKAAHDAKGALRRAARAFFPPRPAGRFASRVPLRRTFSAKRGKPPPAGAPHSARRAPGGQSCKPLSCLAFRRRGHKFKPDAPVAGDGSQSVRSVLRTGFLQIILCVAGAANDGIVRLLAQ